ncbi:MAG: biopolymer transport protein ExbB [Oleiphilaceae bacterium]|jgi:biopolymer transport protein ExbB
MEIISFTLIEKQLGPLSYPLFFCSFFALAILVERFSVLSYYSFSSYMNSQSQQLIKRHGLASRGIREDIAAVWLQKQQAKLQSGIRLLNVMALLAPLLGLLGTVIGLIQVFDSLAIHHGPIEPSMLADGLGVAMKTTAAGLVIAVPALLGAHGFQIWVDKIVQTIEQKMNLHNLELDGISVELLK